MTTDTPDRFNDRGGSVPMPPDLVRSTALWAVFCSAMNSIEREPSFLSARLAIDAYRDIARSMSPAHEAELVGILSNRIARKLREAADA